MEQHPHVPEEQGGEANAEAGFVVLDGPNGVAVAMTPDAADATAASLHEAAEAARGQARDPA